MAEQLYQLKITATGEVRDKDGNLLNTTPVESVRTVTEAEALEILQASAEAQDRK